MRGTLMDCRYNQKESCISFFIWQPPMEKTIATLVYRRVSFAQEIVANCQEQLMIRRAHSVAVLPGRQDSAPRGTHGAHGLRQ